MSARAEHLCDIDKLSQLQCYLFPGRGRRCKPEFVDYYNKAYAFWSANLKEGFRSEGLIEKIETLKSDDFIRHEEFVCLFYHDKPIGLLMFDWMELTLLPTLEHAYLSTYPNGIINSIQENNHSIIMTIGHLTVDTQWRKKKIGPGVSEILTGFMTKRFLESPATALLFVTRNTRSTNTLAYEHGGVPLLRNYEVYGVPSDIVIIYRDCIKQSKIKHIPELTDKLWSNKIVVITNPLEKLYTQSI